MHNHSDLTYTYLTTSDLYAESLLLYFLCMSAIPIFPFLKFIRIFDLYTCIHVGSAL